MRKFEAARQLTATRVEGHGPRPVSASTGWSSVVGADVGRL